MVLDKEQGEEYEARLDKLEAKEDSAATKNIRKGQAKHIAWWYGAGVIW